MPRVSDKTLRFIQCKVYHYICLAIMQHRFALRDRIISSMRKRIAAHDSPQRHPSSLPGSIFLDGFQSVCRAARNVGASGCLKRREIFLIESYPGNHDLLHREKNDRSAFYHFHIVFCNATAGLNPKYIFPAVSAYSVRNPHRCAAACGIRMHMNISAVHF